MTKIGLNIYQWRAIKKASGKSRKEMNREYFLIKKMKISLWWRVKFWITNNLPKR